MSSGTRRVVIIYLLFGPHIKDTGSSATSAFSAIREVERVKSERCRIRCQRRFSGVAALRVLDVLCLSGPWPRQANLRQRGLHHLGSVQHTHRLCAARCRHLRCVYASFHAGRTDQCFLTRSYHWPFSYYRWRDPSLPRRSFSRVSSWKKTGQKVI